MNDFTIAVGIRVIGGLALVGAGLIPLIWLASPKKPGFLASYVLGPLAIIGTAYARLGLREGSLFNALLVDFCILYLLNLGLYLLFKYVFRQHDVRMTTFFELLVVLASSIGVSMVFGVAVMFYYY